MADEHSTSKRDLLEHYLQGVGLHGTEAIPRRPSGSIAPLSASQKELYRRELRVPDIPPLYNECISVRMKGALDVEALEKSFNEIISRHEAWRTTFETRAGRPIQVVHPPMSMHVPVIDLRDFPEAKREAEAERLAGEYARRPFDLSNGPLLRPILIRIGAADQRFFLIAHQIILDGVSAYQIFPSELAAFYKAVTTGSSANLPELPVQCADFACWHREWLDRGSRDQLTYWRSQLGGELHTPSWPAKAKPATRAFRGSIHSFLWERALSDHVKQLARELGTTLFLTLLSGLAIVLHHYTNKEEIVVGTLSPSGRKRSEVMGLLGYFLNPVALRLSFREGMTFAQLVSLAKRVLLEAMSNDDVPIEEVARELGASDISPSPFFTAAISLQPPTPNLDLDWIVSTMDVESGGSLWDLYLAFIDRPDGLIGRTQFNPDLFDKAEIGSVLQDLQELLASMSPKSLVTNARIRNRETAGAVGVRRSTLDA